MIRYEYKMERISLRSAGRELEKLNKFGSAGFQVIQAIPSGTDLVVLLMKIIETKSAPAKKKQTPQKELTKKEQQDIKDVAPATKDAKEAIADLTAEE